MLQKIAKRITTIYSADNDAFFSLGKDKFVIAFHMHSAVYVVPICIVPRIERTNKKPRHS
jgi:hypothetical protein